jgi:hypothetical protein
MRQKLLQTDQPVPKHKDIGDYIVREIAGQLNPGTADRETLSRAWQWKVWLSDDEKTKFDLYKELEGAPGKLRYIPGPVQMAAHETPERTKQVSGGWRAGKSKWLAAELLPYCFRTDARIWIVGNDYDLPREEFSYIRDWLQWMNAPMSREPSEPKDGGWTLWLDWGAVLETMTGKEIQRLEGANLDVVGIAEAGQVSERMVNILHGRVFEKGGDILLSGSLDEALPWYISKFQEFRNGSDYWHSFAIPSWENAVVFPGGRTDPKILREEMTLPADLFKLKICSEIVKPREIVFPEFDYKTHVVPIEFATSTQGHVMDQYYFPVLLNSPEPKWDEYMINQVGWTLPSPSSVELAIDPGWKYAYAVLAICRYGDFVYVIDEVYLQGATAQDVIDECKDREWWPWVRGTSVIDIASEQHHSEGESNFDQWRKNAGIHLRTKKVPIPDGINRLRTFLKDPGSKKTRLWFDSKCQHLIKEFGKYRYRSDKEFRSATELPIDRDNHALKALSYYLVYHYGWDYKRHLRSESYVNRAATWGGQEEKPAMPATVSMFADDFPPGWTR